MKSVIILLSAYSLLFATLSRAAEPGNLHDIVAASMKFDTDVKGGADGVSEAGDNLLASLLAWATPGVALSGARTVQRGSSVPAIPDLIAQYTNSFTAGAGFSVCGAQLGQTVQAKVGVKLARLSVGGTRNIVALAVVTAYANAASSAEEVTFLKYVLFLLNKLSSKLPPGSDNAKAVGTEVDKAMEDLVKHAQASSDARADFIGAVGTDLPDFQFDKYTPDEAEAYWKVLSAELVIPSFTDVVKNFQTPKEADRARLDLMVSLLNKHDTATPQEVPLQGAIEPPAIEAAQKLVDLAREPRLLSSFLSSACAGYSYGVGIAQTQYGGTPALRERVGAGTWSGSVDLSAAFIPLFKVGAGRSKIDALNSSIGNTFRDIYKLYSDYALLEQVIAAQLTTFHAELDTYTSAIQTIEAGDMRSVQNAVNQLAEMRKTLEALLSSVTNILLLKAGILAEIGRLDQI